MMACMAGPGGAVGVAEALNDCGGGGDCALQSGNVGSCADGDAAQLRNVGGADSVGQPVVRTDEHVDGEAGCQCLKRDALRY
jgi:hypothetical protein